MRIYALAVEKPFGLTRLALPLMTLAQAKAAQESLASYGKSVLVVNTTAE